MSEYSVDINKAERALYRHLKKLGIAEEMWEKIKNEFLNGFQDGWVSASTKNSTIPMLIGELIHPLNLDMGRNADKIGKSIGAMAGTLRQHPLFPMQNPSLAPNYTRLYKIFPDFKIKTARISGFVARHNKRMDCKI